MDKVLAYGHCGWPMAGVTSGHLGRQGENIMPPLQTNAVQRISCSIIKMNIQFHVEP